MTRPDLRPAKFEDIVGNDNLKRVLKIVVSAAKKEERAIPHTILHGHYGCGKCLGKGTKVILYDGTTISVELLKVGYMLIGPDTKPRIIKSVCCGAGKLYRIIHKDGSSFIANEPHILSLKHITHNNVINISIKDYLEFKNKKFSGLEKYRAYRIYLDNLDIGFKYFVPKIIREEKLEISRIEYIGIGEYYGFELSGDGLFLLGDFTVTHNTSIARVLAAEIGGAFIEVNAAAIKSKEDLLQLIPKLENQCVLFIDEIHRLKTKHEELFYSLMEDFKAFIPHAGHIQEITIPQFTLVGATTDLGSLSGPFLSRFIQNHSVHMYSDEDLAKIVRLNAAKLKIGINDDAAELIAKRSKNVPRYANNRLTWVKDYCSSEDKVYITTKEVDEALELVGIDEHGFDETDRKYLAAIEKFQPIGLTNLAAAIGATAETVVKYIEPIMLARDIITISREGRTLKSYTKLSDLELQYDAPNSYEYDPPNVLGGLSDLLG